MLRRADEKIFLCVLQSALIFLKCAFLIIKKSLQQLSAILLMLISSIYKVLFYVRIYICQSIFIIYIHFNKLHISIISRHYSNLEY